MRRPTIKAPLTQTDINRRLFISTIEESIPNISSTLLEQYVGQVRLLPIHICRDLDIKIGAEEHARKELVDIVQRHYSGVCLWLYYFLFDREEILVNANSPLFRDYKLYGKQAAETFRWAEKIYPELIKFYPECVEVDENLLPESNDRIYGWEQLGFLLIASECCTRLRWSGVTGEEPPTRKADGKLILKNEGLKYERKRLKEIRSLLRHNNRDDDAWQKASDLPYRTKYVPLRDVILEQCIKLCETQPSSENADWKSITKIDDATVAYIDAIAQINRALLEGEDASKHQVTQARSPQELHRSGPGRRAPRPTGFGPSSPPSRRRKNRNSIV